MDTLFWLDQIEPTDQLQVGEQALHLSLLAKKNYPVMPSAIVPASQFREFLGAIHWLEPFFADLPSSSLRLNVGDPKQLQAIARQIRATIQKTELSASLLQELDRAIPLFPTLNSESQAFILRPSLGLKSLNTAHTPLTLSTEITSLIEPQICRRDPESLAAALKQLWTELFRARNLVYWQRSRLSLQQLHFAVLVQPIASAIASGSLQPRSQQWDLITTPGLEFAIAQGEVVPDLFWITPETELIQFQKRGHQTITYVIRPETPPLQRVNLVSPHPNLSQAQLKQFLSLTQRLKADFSKPIRVEWQFYSMLDPQLYITQIHYQEELKRPLKEDPVDEQIAPLLTGLAASGGNAIAPAYVLEETSATLDHIPEKSILIAPMISPAWLPWLKQAAAIVTEQGGLTSHGALIARELGIPAIVSAAHATQSIKTGDWLLVDGSLGKVYPTLPQKLESDLPSLPAPISTASSLIGTRLMVNLSQPELIDRATTHNIDGIGLLKSELMILTILEQQHPQRWLQQNRQSELIDRLAQRIQQFAAAFFPKPVFYRSLDLRSHEVRSLQGAEEIPPETNPMLGSRGTLRYLQNPALFDVELLALKQVIQSGYPNLRLVLPFVRTVEEFEFCRRRVEQLDLTVPLWIMAEVPSVLFLLPQYVQAGVQGICIGTSDLTQLMLGIDRDQNLMSTVFDQIHPSVADAVVQLIHAANQLGIPSSISTQANLEAGDFLDRLIEAGITAIVVNLEEVEGIYSVIARAEQRFLLKKARNQSTTGFKSIRSN